MITTSSIGRRGLLQASWIILMATVGISQPRDISRKVDPALQQAQAKIGADISMRHSSLEHYAAGVRLPQQEGESVGILVQGGPETRTQIERVGGRIGSQHGDVVTAIVPLRAVEDLARESVVEYIEASRILYDDVNQSVPKTGADILHAQIDPSMRLTGRGVILGFTDSGIDIYHPNFKTATGRTRILYVWDQYAAGTPPAGFIYGAEFDSSRINQGTLLLTPGFHGTHVAGIAAGGGLPTKTYVGMAPEADIIMVVNSGSDLFNRGQTTVGTLDGYDFIRTKAAQLRKRFVINTSQGTNMGPHDGTTLFERALNADVAAGAINVLSAGNEASSGRHASLTLSGSTREEVEFSLSGEMNYLIPLDMWYETNDRIQIEIKKSSASTFLGPVIPGTSQSFSFDSVTVTISSITNSALNNDNQIYLTVVLRTSIPSAMPYRMKLRFSAYENNALPNGGRLDLWWERNYAVRFLTHVDQSRTIGMPAAADSAITVGSYNNATSSLGAVDAISSFSGRGPRRDGTIKPDITGIGGLVVSSYDYANQATLSGTSMSAPHVAGAVALLLQKYPSWTSYDVKRRLRESAVADLHTGSVPNTTWGYGKLNVLRAVSVDGTFPSPPVLRTVSSSGNTTLLNWSDPLLNVDGTSLTNLATVYVFRNGLLIDSVAPGIGTYTDRNVPLGRSSYFLHASTTAGRRSAKSSSQSIVRYQKFNDLLVVDDDGGMNYHTYYVSSLGTLGYAYDLWDVAVNGPIPLDLLRQYAGAGRVVVWLTGDDPYGTVDASEQAAITSLLSAGGRLLISGQDLGYNLYAGGSSSSRSFYQTYLKAMYVQDNVRVYGLSGVSGDIFAGAELRITGSGGANNQRFPDEVDPIPPAVKIMAYDPTVSASNLSIRNQNVGTEGLTPADIRSSGTAALRYQSGNSRVVYFAFGFEALSTKRARDTIMSKTLGWLNAPTLPPPPMLLSPANGATSVSVSPTLSWASVAGSTHYRVQLSASRSEIDQQQSVLDTAAGFTYAIGSSSQQKLAQVIVPAVSGFIIEVRVPIGCSSSSLILEFQGVTGGKPNGVILETATSTGTTVAGSRFRSFFVPSGVGITSGVPVAIVFRSLGSCGMVPGPVGNPYPGGDAFYDASGSPTPTWNSLGNRNDLAFQVVIKPLAIDDSTVVGNSRLVGPLVSRSVHYWRVSSVSPAGQGNFSPAFSFTTLFAPPQPPVLASPMSGARGVPMNPIMKWYRVEDATTYRVQVARDAGFTSIRFDTSGVSDTLVTIRGLDGYREYFWRVQGGNQAGPGTYSTAFTFITVAGPPQLLLPMDGASNVSTNAVVVWARSAPGLKSQLQLATEPLFQTILLNQLGIEDTAFTISGLARLTTYFWRVRSIAASDTSLFSPVYRFTTISNPPSGPTLFLPVNGAAGVSLTPVLSWSPVVDATSYTVQVSDTISFSRLAINDSGLTNSSYHVPWLSSGKTYYWRVSATNSGGMGEFSGVWSFTTLSLTSVEQISTEIPLDFFLSQNYPNPFNPTTRIHFGVPKSGHVTIIVYSLLGQIVTTLLNEQVQAGKYAVAFDATGLPSGTYVVRLTGEAYIGVRRMVLLK